MGQDNRGSDSKGLSYGGIVGGIVGVLVWWLFLRTPGGGYLTVKDNFIVIGLTIVLAGVGAFLGDLVTKRFGAPRESKPKPGGGQQ